MIRPSQRHFAPENLDPRLRAGLVGHWIGGGSGLTWFDRSGYGNHGTLTNGPLWSLGREGRGSALSMDGSDDRVTIPSISHLLSTQGSCSFLVRMNAEVPASTRNGLTNLGDAASENYYPFTNGQAFLNVFRSNRVDSIALSAAVKRTEWHRVTITADSSVPEWRLYQNGILVTTNTSAFTFTVPAVAWTFGRSQSGNYFDGAVEDLRIYNRVLSLAEISLLSQPSFLPVVPRRWSISPVTSITTDATAAYSTWTVPAATARTRYTVAASAALSTWVAPSASAQLNRRRSISVPCSVASYSIPSSSTSYQIEVS